MYVFLALFLSILIYILRAKEISNIIVLPLLCLLSVIIIIHLLGWIGPEKSWFFEDVGLIRAAIFDAIYILFIPFFILTSLSVINEVAEEGGCDSSFLIGIGSFAIILPVYFILWIFTKNCIRYTNYFFIGAQILQIAILFLQTIINRGNIFSLIVCIITYPLIGIASFFLVKEYIHVWVTGMGTLGKLVTIFNVGFW